MAQPRLRDLGYQLGFNPTGPHNAITDVPGVTVGQTTVIHDEPRIARTGVTTIFPRGEKTWTNSVFAGYHSFNGFGEMTGLPWIDEAGLLNTPIGITNTNQIGIVRDAILQYGIERGYPISIALPVVAETWDGYLNDIDAFHVTAEHVYRALDTAASGAVDEGPVGGGTGMICYQFKGGIGTSSRVVRNRAGTFTVGVLVQANHGCRYEFRVDGVPVGLEIPRTLIPTPDDRCDRYGSIIVILATDAPLTGMQCQRLAQRATVGLARTGGIGHNGSGDIFLAFSTGNNLYDEVDIYDLKMLANHNMDELFEGAAEATEEAIYNALIAGSTMTGFAGTVHALPHDLLDAAMRKYGRPPVR